ncbi:MAG: purine-nucleoside phosphorylase [Lachnospiraceae bacterium]|nr:purine-nucleoside phosphorylase [Lachnospiraceae bacterium]
MSTHINAAKGDIAEVVLMPGDPLRAKYVAENFLENAVCYNEVRGMYGFTGTYKGHKISVQGSGMGIPSFMIYVTELFKEYDVKRVLRIGTCGAINKDVNIRDIILGVSANTTSNINRTRFMGYDFCPTADFKLLYTAYQKAEELGFLDHTHVGPILSTDEFYGHDDGLEARYAEYGVLGVEMEAAGLYTAAAAYKAEALAILTVSDHIVTGEATSSEEREKTFTDMMKLALETAIS